MTGVKVKGNRKAETTGKGPGNRNREWEKRIREAE
jgi:hypothetical protein